MEAALVAVAFLLALGLMARGFRGESRQPEPATYGLPAARGLARPAGALPPLTTVVPGQPPLRIFSSRGAEVLPALPPPGQTGADYRLTLTRGAGGRWTSVLRAPESLPDARDGAALTVTLVVPWTELAQRYSAVNLVVR